MLLENDLSDYQSLDGDWEFQLAGGPARPMPVPSAWEARLADKAADGPAFYRRSFVLPEDWAGGRVALECRAVSFDATVFVNGRRAGHHRGMWAPFQIDVTSFVRPGANTIELEVWKPGRRHPVREALAGFLPDVGVPFGGIWQSIGLRRLGDLALEQAQFLAGADGALQVAGQLRWLGARRPVRAELALLAADGTVLAFTDAPADESFAARLSAPGAAAWAPDRPVLHRAELTFSDAASGQPLLRVARRIGLRTARAEGDVVLWNGQPIHLRGVLDWGWDSGCVCPAPPREAVLDQIATARSLGFNLIKLCLFVPDEATFDAADEAGMLLWLELPMWLPQVTPAFRELALREYGEILQRVHHHPSLAIVSLGCELNADADAEFLDQLNRSARAWMPGCLLCDNSGSAEAYGGIVTPLGDFYDYHFYTDPHFFPALVDHFDRACQPRKPWIYGEFCDADTLRDYTRLPADTWWLAGETWLPRDEVTAMREHRARFDEAGVEDGGAALTRIARQQATAVRKFIFEHTRARHASGGYVITGWMDTPVSTSGVVDDHLQLKFPPEEWRAFNADRVLVMDRERRRRWEHGGDRPVYADPFTWRQGDVAEVHLSLSNGRPATSAGWLRWHLAAEDGEIIARGDARVAPVRGGAVSEIAVLKIPLPARSARRLAEYELGARLELDDGDTTNAWRLWAAPRAPDLPALDVLERAAAGGLSDDVLRRADRGACEVVWLTSPDDRFTERKPFWREAIHVFEPHPVWDAIPQPGYADLRFFGLATDFVINPDRLRAALGLTVSDVRPVWGRFDARALTWSEYLVDVSYGAGRLLISTLRFKGGLGRQPWAFDAHPMGAWALSALLDHAGGGLPGNPE